MKAIAASGLRDGRDHVLVAARAAGLDDRGRAGVERDLRAVGEGEEGVGGERRRRVGSWPNSAAFSTAIRTASTRLIWPAPIPIVCRSLTRTIAFDATCLQTRQAKTRSPHCGSLQLARHELPGVALLDLGVGVLHEHPAEHALVAPLAGISGAPLAVEQDARVLLAPQRVERVLGVARREQHLDELLRELLAERRLDLAVEDDHAAVCRGRVGGERLVVRLLRGGADRDAARDSRA